MRVLVDANVFIDYGERAPYAERFFRRALREGWQLLVLKDIYYEVERMSADFGRLRAFIADLRRQSVALTVSPSEDDRREAFRLGEKYASLGLDFADRLLIAVAKRGGAAIFTRDRNLRCAAVREGVALLEECP